MQEAEAMGVCLARTLTSVLCFIAVGKLLRLQYSIYATVGSADRSHDEPVLSAYDKIHHVRFNITFQQLVHSGESYDEISSFMLFRRTV